jgi:methylglyoxal reductase
MMGTNNVFPRSGERISKLGFGAMGLSGSFGSYDDEYLIRSVLLALDGGINFIDTARAYGRSEELVGKALKQWTGERPFVATKVAAQPAPASYPPGSCWHAPVPVEIAYPSGMLRASVLDSLQQLGLEQLDLIQLHQYWAHWDDSDYWMEELLRLQEEGLVRYIGISVPDHRHELAIALVRSGKIDAVQTLFNIFDPLALDCLIPICRQHQVAVIARIILDEGGLTGFLKADTHIAEGDFRANYFDVLPRSIYIDKINALQTFIPQYAESLAELAIRFALQPEGITTAITSMHVHEFIRPNLEAAARPELPQEVFELLRNKHRWIRNFYQARRYL